MPRQLRIEYEGALYHLLKRGDRREAIYCDVRRDVEVAHRSDGSCADASFGTDLLLTLEFDDSGAWKIIKTHEMSEKEVKQKESTAN